MGNAPEVDEERRAYLDAVLIGGREPATVVIADPDPAWPARYAAVREVLLAALGGRALAVEHVGSTAVPGLAAKPVVDVQVTVEDVEDEAAYAPALEAAGFVLRVREAGHRMFRTPQRDVQVHVHERGDPALAERLDLRDRLRQSPDDRALYEATKRALATREWADVDDYADAKSEVIAEILARAGH
jgi:GrpB-like predicted nucleotidyltransferase (UPF0157 family)